MTNLTVPIKPSRRIRALAALAVLAVILLPLLALAQSTKIENPILSQTFQQVVNRVVAFANSIVAPLSTLMVLIAGYLYMTGGGDPEKLKTAHRVIIWSLVGIAIVLLANSAEVIIRELLGGPKP